MTVSISLYNTSSLLFIDIYLIIFYNFIRYMSIILRKVVICMYRTLFQNRNYVKLLSANMINRLGDGIDSIAFTWLTYALTKNASLSAIVFAANVLPTVLFQPLAAPFVDRMQKQKVMVWSELLRGLSLSGFLLLFLTDFLQPWMFVAFTFLFNSIEAFRIPAGVSYLPKVLANEELDEGINFNQIFSFLHA